VKARIELLQEELSERRRIEVQASRRARRDCSSGWSSCPHPLRRATDPGQHIQDPGRLADFIAGSLQSLSTAEKQEMLETLDVRVRLERVNKVLAKDLES